MLLLLLLDDASDKKTVRPVVWSKDHLVNIFTNFCCNSRIYGSIYMTAALIAPLRSS